MSRNGTGPALNGVVRRNRTTDGQVANEVDNRTYRPLTEPSELKRKSDGETLLFGFLHRTVMPVFLILFIPNLIIVMWYTATHCNGSFLLFIRRTSEHGLLYGLWKIWTEIHLASSLSVSVLLGYIVFALALMVAIPGKIVKGPVTPKGNVPTYTDNGFYCFVVTIAMFVIVTYALKVHGMSPTIVYDHYDEFLGTLTVFSHVLCIFLLIKGRVAPTSTDSGTSGNLIFDYYWGTELYPRVLGVDIKVFTNCRFGMTIWPLLCLIFALKSYELHGFVDSMWVSCALQMLYFAKFFWWEAGYMHTIDIMLDRAGWYICWACMVYIPGGYASVSLYLVHHPLKLGPALSTAILSAGILAIAVNYWVDLQKQIVRRTDGACTIWGRRPGVIRARFTLENGETRESLLLVSGFWGVARHFHYVPELILAFCWSVPGGFENLMCYTYFIYLCILLVHRTYRDEWKCSQKYGKYWKQYCREVRYKMIPGIF